MSHVSRWGWIGMLACLLPLATSAHEHAMHAAPVATGGPALGADAAFAPDGRLWVVDVAARHVRLRYSDNLGETLSAPVDVNAVAENIDARAENRPRIALGPDGAIYVSWVQDLAKQWASYVRFARSTDGGKTFSKPIVVHGDRAEITHSFNAMLVNGQGEPVIAWIDARGMDAAMAAHRKYRGLAVYYAWSTNHGASFAHERKVMDHSCECCRIALARKPNGNVAAMFRGVYGDNIRDHAFAVLPTDGAPVRPERVTFSQWQIVACPEQGPGLAIGGHSTLHAVWYVARDGPQVWYGQLDPGHPPKHKLLLGGPGASHADVAVDGQTVWVAWNQVDANGYTLLARVSHDGGVHFDAARALATSARAVYSPQLLVHDGKAYVAWNTSAGFRLISAGGE